MVLWLASPRSIASDYVKFEIATAAGNNRPIGPIYLEPMDPSRLPAPFNLKLANVQGIEWFEGPEEANLERLARDLRGLLHAGRWKRVAAAAAVALTACVVALAAWQFQAFSPRPRAIVGNPRQTEPTAGDWAAPPQKPLPAAVARLPAAEVLKIAYGGAPPLPAADAKHPALELEILARQHTQSNFARLKDGDALASQQDDYFLALRPLTGGFLYVFQINSVGKKTWLFPRTRLPSIPPARTR